MATTKTVLADHISWRRVEDKAVLLNLENSEYYTFNASGCRLLELLEDSTGPEDLAQRLGNEFTTTPDSLLADVNKILARLQKEGLSKKVGMTRDRVKKAPVRHQTRTRRQRYEAPDFRAEGRLSEVAAAFKP